jgi:hypothetical protein
MYNKEQLKLASGLAKCFAAIFLFFITAGFVGFSFVSKKSSIGTVFQTKTDGEINAKLDQIIEKLDKLDKRKLLR